MNVDFEVEMLCEQKKALFSLDGLANENKDLLVGRKGLNWHGEAAKDGGSDPPAIDAAGGSRH